MNAQKPGWFLDEIWLLRTFKFFLFISYCLLTLTFYFSVLLSLTLNEIDNEEFAIHSYSVSYGLTGIDFLCINQPKYPHLTSVLANRTGQNRMIFLLFISLYWNFENIQLVPVPNDLLLSPYITYLGLLTIHFLQMPQVIRFPYRVIIYLWFLSFLRNHDLYNCIALYRFTPMFLAK